jgi:hypothetical protein
MKCKVCGAKFHYCTSCGWDRDLHPLSAGFCSWECLRKGNGPEYPEDDEEETSTDDAVEAK